VPSCDEQLLQLLGVYRLDDVDIESGADRSAGVIETQRRLKREAAERRLKAADEAAGTRPARRSATGKTRGSG